ncbi:MAG: hypothetical protein PHW96_04140 [Candidatus Nanoarchaeia archaeon]|nr:hypothetical protein [Candidatus Nanoarchaeia archaeon]
MLYWCEGDKYTSPNRYKVAITTTDVKMQKLFVDWLKEYYLIDKNQIKLRLHIWEDINEEKAKEYWANELNIPLENFTKSWVKEKKGNKKVHKNGLCRASIDNKELFNKIMRDINSEFLTD